MTTWEIIRSLHVTSVVASLSLFFVRGLWMIADSVRLRQKWVKVVPHVVDTVLLSSALVLAWMSAQYPFQQDWLTAKVIALLVYIGLGMVALRFGRTKPARTAAWLAGLLVFAYIVLVAATRDALPVLGT